MYKRRKRSGWIGVDLDGTLAHDDGAVFDPYTIGAPIPAMVERVKRWMSDGVEVRIFTARVSGPPAERKVVRAAIRLWWRQHVGQMIPEITNVKDHDMLELYDDRAVAVEPNTGKLLSRSRRGFDDPDEGSGLRLNTTLTNSIPALPKTRFR